MANTTTTTARKCEHSKNVTWTCNITELQKKKLTETVFTRQVLPSEVLMFDDKLEISTT